MKRSIVSAIALSFLFAGAGEALAKPKPAATATLAADLKWTPLVPQLGAKGPQVSVVFGELGKKAPFGAMIKIPPGGRSPAHVHSSDYWGVVVSGTQHDHAVGQASSAKDLTAGSWWAEPANLPHENFCSEGAECVLFVYFPNGFDTTFVQTAQK